MAQQADNLSTLAILLNNLPVPIKAIAQDREALGDFSTATGWTVLGTDTVNLATSATHIMGTTSLEFDKVDGAANTIYAGIQSTITAVNCSRFVPTDQIISSVYVSDKTNVAYAFIRLGTSVSHYNEWRLADTAITAAAWQSFGVALDACQITVVGNGWNPAAIAYISVGVAFDAEANALADIKFDHVLIESAILTTT